MRALTVILLIAPLCVGAEKDAKPVEKKAEDMTARVSGTATVPADVESFTGRVLELRLYKYDPRIAGKAADLVEVVTVKDFAHTKGKATAKEFSLGKKEKLDDTKGYYLTLFVLDGKERTHMGQCDHVKEPFNKVLTKGMPREVKATLKPIKR